MQKINHNLSSAQKRQQRVRSKIRGTSERPRLTVFRSNRYTALQVIDDQTGKTLAASNELKLAKAKKMPSGTKSERAVEVAKILAADLKKHNITQLAFDRGSYRYHGRVRLVAETLRQEGINL